MGRIIPYIMENNVSNHQQAIMVTIKWNMLDDNYGTSAVNRLYELYTFITVKPGIC